MKASIQNKMRIEKCDAYKGKEILGYRGGKSYVSAARGTTVETIPQSKNHSPLMRRKEESME